MRAARPSLLRLAERRSPMALPRTLITGHQITAHVALAALDRLQHDRVPLGRLAVREGLLKLGPLLHILDEQLDEAARGEPRRFGRIAVELGYLSEAQVEALLQKQREQSPTLEAILMDLAALEDPPQWAPGGDGRREPPA